jgi:ATP-dependent Clp protease ATP-binding subunit ClpC
VRVLADQFRGLSEQTRGVVQLALEEAARGQRTYAGSQDLLLGLVRAGQGVAPSVLAEAGVTPDKVRDATSAIVGRGDQPTVVQGLTPRARLFIDRAAEEARQLGHPVVGPDHLFLAMIRDGESLAGKVLESLEFRDLPAVRERVRGALTQASPG